MHQVLLTYNGVEEFGKQNSLSTGYRKICYPMQYGKQSKQITLLAFESVFV